MKVDKIISAILGSALALGFIAPILILLFIAIAPLFAPHVLAAIIIPMITVFTIISLSSVAICVVALIVNFIQNPIIDYMNEKAAIDTQNKIYEDLSTGKVKLTSSIYYLAVDRKAVEIAVNYNGLELKFASESFKNDKDIVMTAVKQNGLALQFASQRLKKDPEIIKAANEQKVTSLNSISSTDLKSVQGAPTSTLEQESSGPASSHSNSKV